MSNIAKRHGLLFLLVAAAMVLAAGTSLCAGERTLAEFAAFLQGKIADNTKVNLPRGVAVLGAEQRSGQLVILDPSRDWSAPEALLWHWDPSKAPGLEPAARRLFGTEDPGSTGARPSCRPPVLKFDFLAVRGLKRRWLRARPDFP